jgi:hypothetical protein
MRLLINERKPADDQIPHAVLFKNVKQVFKILENLHGFLLAPPGGLSSGPAALKHFVHVAAYSRQRRQALLRRLALPKIQIPGFGLFKVCRAMGHHS